MINVSPIQSQMTDISRASFGTLTRRQAKKHAKRLNMGLKPFIHTFSALVGGVVVSGSAPERTAFTIDRIIREKSAKRTNKISASLARSRSGK